MKVIDGYDLASCRRDVDLSQAWLTQPEGIGDICLRNDQNIPFSHLHHHHGTRAEQPASLAKTFASAMRLAAMRPRYCSASRSLVVEQDRKGVQTRSTGPGTKT
jgi:hypothetical protein